MKPGGAAVKATASCSGAGSHEASGGWQHQDAQQVHASSLQQAACKLISLNGILEDLATGLPQQAALIEIPGAELCHQPMLDHYLTDLVE